MDVLQKRCSSPVLYDVYFLFWLPASAILNLINLKAGRDDYQRIREREGDYTRGEGALCIKIFFDLLQVFTTKKISLFQKMFANK